MKKIFLAVFALVSMSLVSQAQFRVGVKAGGNLSHQRVNGSGGNSLFSNDHTKNYHAGLITEFKIAERVYIQPQLLYTQKGSTLLSSTGAPDMKVKINYVEMPVNVLYKLPVSFGNIFAGGGAAFSYGFGGKLDSRIGVRDGHKQSVFADNKTWRREDISLSFTAGVEFDNGLFLSVNSQKGLLDVYKASNVSVKNSSVSVSIGYMIDWKSLKRKG